MGAVSARLYTGAALYSGCLTAGALFCVKAAARAPRPSAIPAPVPFDPCVPNTALSTFFHIEEPSGPRPIEASISALVGLVPSFEIDPGSKPISFQKSVSLADVLPEDVSTVRPVVGSYKLPET